MSDLATSVQYAGLLQDYARKAYEAGKVAPEAEEARVKIVLKKQREKIQPIYGIKEKIIEGYEPGKFINILI